MLATARCPVIDGAKHHVVILVADGAFSNALLKSTRLGSMIVVAM